MLGGGCWRGGWWTAGGSEREGDWGVGRRRVDGNTGAHTWDIRRRGCARGEGASGLVRRRL